MRPLRGFTLIELLTVIAIVGILAAILIPTVGKVRESARKAKVKTQLSQWAVAVEAFRSEYGYYPTFDSSNLVNGGATTTVSGDHLFHDILTGRKRDGGAISAAASVQNRKRIAFCTFAETDFNTSNLIQDAFENTSIAVLVDKNVDGIVRVSGTNADYSMLPEVAIQTGGLIRPALADFPSNGIRAGVVLYSAAPGATTAKPQFVFSWK